MGGLACLLDPFQSIQERVHNYFLPTSCSQNLQNKAVTLFGGQHRKDKLLCRRVHEAQRDDEGTVRVHSLFKTAKGSMTGNNYTSG